MIVDTHNNTTKYNSNDSNNNYCRDEQQQCDICKCKKLDILDDKLDCLQQILINLEQLVMKLYREFFSNNNNNRISQINYNNRGWR